MTFIIFLLAAITWSIYDHIKCTRAFKADMAELERWIKLNERIES